MGRLRWKRRRGRDGSDNPDTATRAAPGAVGTVSKPIVGVLDFANGIASAIRETSRVGVKIERTRIREARCCSTSGALLTVYSTSEANGQKILYQVNGFDQNEKFIAIENLKSYVDRNSNRTEQTLVGYFLLLFIEFS